MLKKSLILGLLLASASTELLAQTVANRTLSKDEQACARDVTRHCRKVANSGDMVVLRCLQDHRQKLATACRKVLEENGQ